MAHTDLAEPQSPPRRAKAAALETICSFAALAAIAALFLNWLDAYLTFFGDPAVVDPEQVRNYWVILAVLGVSVVGSFAGAASRRARRAYVWHVLVSLVGTAAGVLFAVTTAGPVQDDPAPPRPHYTGPQCHSGGDSDDCPGG